MVLPAHEKLGAFYLGREVDVETKGPRSIGELDSRDITTHAARVGMTSSGKTGLCLAMIEEAAIDGVPCWQLIPKATSLILRCSFRNWATKIFSRGSVKAKPSTKVARVCECDGRNVEEGLSDWQEDGDRIQPLMDAAEVSIYTPGSTVGWGSSVLRSFATPDEITRADNTALKELISGAAGGLLSLLGIDADPLKSREHILLSTEMMSNAGKSEG